MNLKLTDKAIEHIQQMLEKRGHGIGIRVSTRQYGCSGYGYAVDYADEVKDDDEVLDTEGIKLVVDRESLSRIDGTTIDYVRMNALNEGFEFLNPNAVNSCGCGESFTV
jgi:iron-sulfur cluster assembly protein